MMGGLQPSDLIILAGRPGMGKTSLATNIAFNVAKRLSRRAAAGRHDQDRRRRHRRLLLARNVGRAARDAHHRRAVGRPLLQDPPRRHHRAASSTASRDAAREMQRIPFYIDDTGGISIAQLAARARRLKRQRGLDLLVVDYLQLLSGSPPRAGENRVQEVTEITTGLKALAKELDGADHRAVAALAPGREPRRQAAAALRPARIRARSSRTPTWCCSSIREEYYLKNKEPKEGTEEHLQVAGRDGAGARPAEVIIGKQRHGPTGTVAAAVRGRDDALLQPGAATTTCPSACEP